MKTKKASHATNSMREKIVSAIRSIPGGNVATYGGVAKAAGYPRHARQVVATLRASVGLPWHRVLGAGGEIKLRGDYAVDQRLRLQAEGVAFRGRRVDLKRHEYRFPATKPQKSRGRKRLSTSSKRK